MAKKSEVVSIPEIKEKPLISSPEWTEYVMSLLTDKEIINGFPKCDGLRRVFEMLMGPIITMAIDVKQVPQIDKANRSTVVVSVQYRNSSGELITVMDATDVDQFNTMKPFCSYPTATAVTGAEGRCLRKAMRLVNVITNEESQIDQKDAEIGYNLSNNQPATATQKNIINSISGELGINVAKLLASIEDFEGKVTDVTQITYSQAQIIIPLLKQYRLSPDDGGKMIPKDILN